MSDLSGAKTLPHLSINPLLKSLRPENVAVPGIDADAIAFAVSNIFTNQISPVQTAILLYTLSLTGLEQRPDILAKCATVMREAAVSVDTERLQRMIEQKAIKLGNYNGGLCDIVGTGGDGHSTFNISTASSIIASSLLLIAKHGNRASTSKSGSADVLAAMRMPAQPRLEVVGPEALAQIYETTNYAFLFAPNFHKGLRHVAATRKEIPCPTIFNLLGPLTNPVEAVIEARMIGVKKQDLVRVFAEALRLNGAKKAIVVCGAEDLDEISCAGPSYCARLVSKTQGTEEDDEDEEVGANVEIVEFELSPHDFGLPTHALSTVSPGRTPEENAEILRSLLSNEMADDDPILHFVLLNVAALFVISGVCDGRVSAFEGQGEVITEEGPGGGRWKEGVRLARLALSSGKALQSLREFAEVTSKLDGAS